jgi:hypothetical protein
VIEDRIGHDPGSEIRARIFDPSGQPVSDVFTVNSEIAADQYNPDVAALRARVDALTEAFPLYPGLQQ